MPLGITKNLVSWRFRDTYVERQLDNAAYTAAHPDDTLVLSGPARRTSADATTAESGVSSLLAIGMLQNVQFGQVKQTQPVQAIGSGRSFFVSGKAQGQGQMSRLFVNGRNLLRCLYHNAVASGVEVEKFDDKPADDYQHQFYINLDSELYLIPFGLATLFRTKAHDNVGGFYAELSMINQYSVAFQAGQNMIAENVTFLFDRLMPYHVNDVLTPEVPRATMDAVVGFSDQTQETEDATTDNLVTNF